MRHYFATILSFLFFTACGQNDAVQNRLYSADVMQKLNKEITSKNSRFNPRKEDHLYAAKPQGYGVYLTVKGLDAGKINSLIIEKISLSDLQKRYPDYENLPDVFFTKFITDDGKHEKVRFQTLNLNNENYSGIDSRNLDDYKSDMTGNWVVSYYESSKPEESVLTALFIKKEMPRSVLPVNAMKAIHYADYMIDTNTHIYIGEQKYFSRFYYSSKPSKIDTLIRKAKAEGIYPVKEKTELSAAQEKRLKSFLKEVSELLLKDGASGYEMEVLEAHVEKYLSKNEALALKRHRQVVGQCSMDRSPIVHATNIARLAGETCCMEIFLRSHLDVLNDTFQRMSDGSYAQPGRSTYSKELESLGVNFEYLIPGILLKADQLPVNHYYGNVGRLGRALAELDSGNKIYQTIESYIADQQLDLYNRLTFVFMAEAYNYNLKIVDFTTANSNLKRLKEIIACFPVSINVALQKRFDKI